MSNLVKVVDGQQEIVPAEDESVIEKNIEAVKRYINFKDNPDPDKLVVIVAVMFIVIYYIYIAFIKTSLSGQWYDGRNTYIIEHNAWTDDLRFSDLEGSWSARSGVAGHASGGAVYMYINERWLAGVYSDDVISWVKAPDGRSTPFKNSVWKRIQ